MLLHFLDALFSCGNLGILRIAFLFAFGGIFGYDHVIAYGAVMRFAS